MNAAPDTVIVYCHPNDREKTNKLLKTVEEELVNNGHQFHTHNIIGDLFSSVLLATSEDLPELENSYETISTIQHEIGQCKNLIFVFPFYWDQIATYIREFVDHVFFAPDEYGNTFASNKNLKSTNAAIITSMRIPQILFSSRSAAGYSDPFTVSILKLIGIRNIKWFNIGLWSELNENIKNRRLEKIREYIRAL